MENLELLATVVEQASLNKASQLLNISQPALSRKIMRLEEDLGVQLFTRKGKRLELTRVGQVCYEYALELRHLDRKFQHAIQEYKAAGKHSSITIGASLTTLQATLPDLITIYVKANPLTEIKALTGKTHEIVTMVKEKKVDIGLVASTINAAGLHCEPLFDDHLCLVLPLGHKYIDLPALAISDLNNLPMILFSKGTWYRVLMDELFHRYSILPDVQMEIDSFEAILRLVSTCKTATLLPQSYLRGQNSELVLRNIPELEQTTRTTSLIYLNAESALTNPAIQPFIQKTKEYFHKE
ncbi:HTH-type transcriptional regulator GltR [compost metagenome]